ncbi:hypothetical protein ABT093_39485 [Kitasatospora sp. NPDC002551]|uniref:hypothetical protein n=1 Tax=unclassified Kitasatospora TaxID=2633591 RepID=UPI003330BAC9
MDRPERTADGRRRGRAGPVTPHGVALWLRGRAWEALCGGRPRSVLTLGLLSLALLTAGLRGCAPEVFWTALAGWAGLIGAAFGLLRGCRRAD